MDNSYCLFAERISEQFSEIDRDWGHGDGFAYLKKIGAFQTE